MLEPRFILNQAIFLKYEPRFILPQVTFFKIRVHFLLNHEDFLEKRCSWVFLILAFALQVY